MVDCTILNSLLSKYIPEITEHLTNTEFDNNLNNFIYKWFVSMFTQNFEEEYSLIIWDFIFLEGSIVIFKAALAIFMNLKNSILENSNFEDLYLIFSNMSTLNREGSYDQLRYYLGLRHFEFDNNFLNINRKKFIKPILETLKIEGTLYKDKAINKHYDSCNKEWPFCLQDNKNILINNLTYRTGTSVNIVEDYFFKEITNKYNQSVILKYEDLLTERRHHICNLDNPEPIDSAEIDKLDTDILDIRRISESFDNSDTFFADTDDDFTEFYKTIKMSNTK